MQPICDLKLKIGGLLNWQVNTPPSLIVEVNKKGVVVLTPEGKTVFIEYQMGNWGSIVGYAPVIEAVLNEESGIVHEVVNGRPVCGARFTQNAILASKGSVNCERCLKLEKGI